MNRHEIRFVVAFIVTSCLGGRATADEKRALSLDDIYRQEQFTDFVVSPKGDEAVYVRNWYDVNLPGKRTSLWRVDGDTGRQEPLEAGEPDGRMPVYSPDGTYLLFSGATRGFTSPPADLRIPTYSERVGWLWSIDLARQERRAQMLAFGDWVPNDGFYGRIAFSATGERFAYIRCRSSAVLSSGPVDRHPTGWRDDQGEGYEGLRESNIEIGMRPRGGSISHIDTIRSNFSSPRWLGDPQWTPEESQLICHANLTDDQESVRYSINKNFNLWRFELDKGNNWSDAIGLTSNPGPDVSPRVSPDGKRVLYLSVPRNGPHNDVFNLCVLALGEKDAEPNIVIDAHHADRAADGTPPFQPTFPLRDDSWIDDEHVRVRGVRGLKSETLVFNINRPNEPADD